MLLKGMKTKEGRALCMNRPASQTRLSVRGVRSRHRTRHHTTKCGRTQRTLLARQHALLPLVSLPSLWHQGRGSWLCSRWSWQSCVCACCIWPLLVAGFSPKTIVKTAICQRLHRGQVSSAVCGCMVIHIHIYILYIYTLRCCCGCLSVDISVSFCLKYTVIIQIVQIADCSVKDLISTCN